MGEVNEWYQLREWNSTFDYSKLVGYHEIWTADLHRGSRTVVKTGVLELVKLHDNKKKITKRKEVEVCVCVCVSLALPLHNGRPCASVCVRHRWLTDKNPLWFP
jgi:hypothetical protein